MLKDFCEPQLTLSRVRAVIETAMEREGYGPGFSAETAAEAAYMYSFHKAVWDNVLKDFSDELAKAGQASDQPLDAIIVLSSAVKKALIEQDAALYKETIAVEELQSCLQALHLPLEYTDLYRLLVAELVVGGKSYLEEECECELEAIGISIQEVCLLTEKLNTVGIKE